jgi:hypothetical protein
VAQWRSTERMGSQLGAEALKSCHGTSHLRARCEPFIIELAFVSLPLCFRKLEHFTMLNFMLQFKNLCNNSLLCGLGVCDVLLYNYYFSNDDL